MKRLDRKMVVDELNSILGTDDVFLLKALITTLKQNIENGEYDAALDDHVHPLR